MHLGKANFRCSASSLSDRLPWATLVKPGDGPAGFNYLIPPQSHNTTPPRGTILPANCENQISPIRKFTLRQITRVSQTVTTNEQQKGLPRSDEHLCGFGLERKETSKTLGKLPGTYVYDVEIVGFLLNILSSGVEPHWPGWGYPSRTLKRFLSFPR